MEITRNKSFNIFFMGRLEKIKGVDVLISSFVQLYEKYPDCRLIIAGNGSCRDDLQRRVANLDIADVVSFVGFIEQERKIEYFKMSSVFVLPSNYETFGMVVLEAMSYRVPVVASRIGGLQEVVKDGETGLLFEPGNQDELLKKMEELYSDEAKRKRLARAAYARLQDDFSVARMGDEYYDFVRNLTTEIDALIP